MHLAPHTPPRWEPFNGFGLMESIDMRSTPPCSIVKSENEQYLTIDNIIVTGATNNLERADIPVSGDSSTEISAAF